MVHYQMTGKHSHALFKKETTWGTAVVPDTDFGLVQNVTHSGDNGLIRAHGLSTTQTQIIEAGNFNASGTLEFIMQHGRILELLVGSPSAEAQTSSDYKHSFNTHDSLLDSFSLDASSSSTADVKNIYAGCLFNTGTISLENGGLLMFRGDWVAKTLANTTSASTAVVDNLRPLTAFQASLSAGADGSEATVVNVQRCEFTVNNTVERVYGYGSRLPTFGTNNNQELSFRFTAGFGDSVEHELFLGGTAPVGTSTPTLPSAVFNVNNGVSLGSGRLELNIDCNSCRFQSFSRPVAINGMIYQDFVAWPIGFTDLFFVDDIASY